MAVTGIQLSLLDRLTDTEPRVNREARASRAQMMRELKSALRRDLEWLFNTHRQMEPVPTAYRETTQSLFLYGLPDLTGRSLLSEQEQDTLATAMEELLRVFEPRLQQVYVRTLPVSGSARVIRFQIEGYLRVQPAPERIVFDSIFDPAVGQHRVEGDSHAG